MEHTIRHEKVKMDVNPMLFTIQFSKKLESLREMGNDMRQTTQKGEEHGFTREQYPLSKCLNVSYQRERTKI